MAHVSGAVLFVGVLLGVTVAAGGIGNDGELAATAPAAAEPTRTSKQAAASRTTDQYLSAAPAPAYAGMATGPWMHDVSSEPWSAYSQPAAAGMIATSPEPLAQKKPHAPAHRMGHFAVKLPQGATNLHLQLQNHDDFIFGTAYNPETAGSADDLAWYNNITSSMFNGLTPENRFKWFDYEPQPGNYSAARALLDQQYIQFAQQHGFKLARGHTLEWYKTEGFWAHQLDCDSYIAALKERITRDVAHFKGKFQQYDVFNEIIDYPGMLDTCNLWDTVFPDAFKWAHEIDPEARLCLNDYSLIEAGAGPKLMKIIQDHLLPHAAPIHCIGIQAHFEHFGINITHQQQQLDLLATLGLDLYITEFTLFTTWQGPPILPDHPNGWPVSYLDEGTAANATVDLFELWFSHPAIKGIFMWGFWDANIWIPNAGIYNANKTPKKAALAIQNWLKGIRTEVEVAEPAGLTEFRGYYGTYEYSYETQSGTVQQGLVRFSRGRVQDPGSGHVVSVHV